MIGPSLGQSYLAIIEGDPINYTAFLQKLGHIVWQESSEQATKYKQAKTRSELSSCFFSIPLDIYAICWLLLASCSEKIASPKNIPDGTLVVFGPWS